MAQIAISAAAVAIAMALTLIVMPFRVGGDTSPVQPPIGMPNCITLCGDVEVPYPFGLGQDASCYLPGFNLTCNTTGSRPRLLLDTDGTLEVPYIGGVNDPFLVVQRNGDIKVELHADGNGNGVFSRGLRLDGPYTLAGGEHELILTGCNVQATMLNGNVTLASCTSLCDEQTSVYVNSLIDRCSGGSNGCCRANIITPGYDDDGRSQVYSTGNTAYDVQLRRLRGWNRSADRDQFPMRVFVADRRWFDNTSVSNDLLQTRQPPSKETMAVPLTLMWEVVGHPNSSSLCKSNHSERINGTRGGYICHCKDGYQGNPYLKDGCKDRNECEWPLENTPPCHGQCINTEGSFTCGCPPGTTGDFTILGGCVNTTIDMPESCMRWCGDVEVPYPFGIGLSNCYSRGFGLLCDDQLLPQLLLGNGQFRVVNISLPNSTMRVIGTNNLSSHTMWLPSQMATEYTDAFPSFSAEEVPYSLSTSNELVLTGCNVHAMLVGPSNPAIISGCASFCYNNDTGGVWGQGWSPNGINDADGSSGGGSKYCYGNGCCKARISESMDGMPTKLDFKWINTNSQIGLPIYAFVAEEGWFDSVGVTGKLMRGDDLKVPQVLQWEVFLSHNGSSSANMSSHPECDVGDQASPRDLICKSKHSQCKRGNRGYTCQCNKHYQGNPYVTGGCEDTRSKKVLGKRQMLQFYFISTYINATVWYFLSIDCS
ncbi:hypothetical protein ZWY2020_016052 [Hordeum vulgare]|nr:hypothetical protein ZWY2020_016052 [Hordeum vulgare]